MELLNRQIQKAVLVHLAGEYPEPAELDALGFTNNEIAVNAMYLQEYGLIVGQWSAELGGRTTLLGATITARGMDFLSDDGGLGAILGVVTVRLHEETLKNLIIEQIEKSENPKTVKERLVEQVRNLPAEVTKSAVLDAAKLGLQKAPDLAIWIARWLI
ncbi:hypothetical protein [Xanthobacter flavus]|uniref:hypothetical protein n=1 Tax=Xanthobacter flavus TaxID=281 RepID=UPI00372A3787